MNLESTTPDERTLDLTTSDADETLSLASASVRAPARGPAPTIPRGTLIGRYVVLSLLGAGAMGVVLAAYDPKLDRKVALKLLAARGRNSTAARARLEREAQALAKLDHRNVVSVYDVGVHGDQLFVAMELVAGQTLGEWMRSVERPRPWKQVLSVFVDAGRGLAAAHEAGLVHRDFKPDNVMLGDDARVRVMDFGLARGELDDARERDEGPAEMRSPTLERLTQTGTMMGTPAYMSAEQTRGLEVDARTDQFSFCVALYEALYGQRPFPGETMTALFEAVRAGEIRGVPQGASVPSWLHHALVKGLASDREQRWPTMAALLDALADDPMPRRRRWSAVALLVALLGGGAWGVTAALQADARFCQGGEAKLAGVWDPSRRAAVEQTILSTELSYAPDTWESVAALLDAYAADWVAARVDACEATHQGEQSSALLDLRMACLDERLLHLRSTVDELTRADTTVVEKAVQVVQALPRLDRCADVGALMADVRPPDDPAVAEQVAKFDEQVIEAKVKDQAGKCAEGLLLTEVVLAEAPSLDYEPLLARAWLQHGELQRCAGRYEDAEASLMRALDSSVARHMPTEAAQASAELLHVVGYQQARHEAARPWALLADSLSRAANTTQARSNYLRKLSAVVISEGNYENARAYIEQALAIDEQSLGTEQLDLALSLDSLGVVLQAEGDYAAARVYHERSLAIRERALGPAHPDVAASLNNLGTTANAVGRSDEARVYYQRALVIFEEAFGPDHPLVANAHNNLGTVASDPEQARAHYQRALAIYEKTLEPDHPKVALTLGNLGATAFEVGEVSAARAYFERSLAIEERTLGPEHPDVAPTLNNVGAAMYAEGNHEQARAYHERALAIYEHTLGPEHPLVANTLSNLGIAAYYTKQYQDARAYYERSLAIDVATLEPDHPNIANTRFGIAMVLWDAPANEGRDRPRARELAQLARNSYARAGESEMQNLEVVDAWLVEHPL